MTNSHSRDSAVDENGTHTLERVMDTALELIKDGDGEYYLLVTGTSMLPLIQGGDYVRIKKFSGELHRGDIVVYLTSSVLFTHRILRINRRNSNGTTYITKGDNSILPDPPIEYGVIIGKVVAVRRNSREMRLDNRGWQITNHLIGSVMLGFVKLYSAVMGTKKVEPGEDLGILNRFFRRFLLMISSLVIKLILVLIGRWQTTIPHEG